MDDLGLVETVDRLGESIGLTDPEHPSSIKVAKIIVGLAKDGERDPARLRDLALKFVGPGPLVTPNRSRTSHGVCSVISPSIELIEAAENGRVSAQSINSVSTEIEALAEQDEASVARPMLDNLG
jgi:hypothetical protein